jgi:hypothetical protein
VTGLGKIVRALAGVAVIVVLLTTVNGWYGEYRRANQASRSSSTVSTGTVESTQVVPVAGSKKVVILVDGVVLRVIPSKGGASVRTLKKNEQLILVGTTVAGWLQLRDSSNGKMGYVANDTASIQVQK